MFLPSLDEAYSRRGSILGAALLACLTLAAFQRQKILILEARPSVKEESHSLKEKHVAKGKIKTTTRKNFTPDGKLASIEKVKEEEPQTTDSTERLDTKREETPARAPQPRYLAGVVLNPAEGFRGGIGGLLKSAAPRVGVTIGGRLDVAYSKTLSLDMRDGHRIDTAWRFGGR